uniref:Peptidase S1 domain-containing protein n=1 Tax=Amazona collaria TaxID=241587 RepID=A0A8B9F808_9PSIT
MNHRIQDWFRLEAHPVPTPCHGQGHLPLDRVAPSPVQPGVEHCQGWDSHSFSGQPVPGPQHPHREELLPKISSQSPLCQVKAIAPCPAPTGPCPKPLSHSISWQVVTNPNWNSNTLSNDIALLKLASPAKLGPRVSPVCLPPADLHLPDNLQCVTTGWGRTSINSNALAESLQQVSLPLISSSKCAEYWGSKITSSMVCAGGVGASSCQGDSGGPLVYQDGGLWTLIGIVSWGSSNCNVNTPGAYARVSHFRNWIDSIIQA